MFAADDMDMTDPKEYLYLVVIFNAVETLIPWQGGSTKHHNPRHAFQPVFLVCYICTMQ